MMNYDNYNFWRMHFIWWIIRIFFILWIFATPYNIPGQRAKKDTPLGLLKKRFASAEISKEEYEENEKLIDG